MKAGDPRSCLYAAGAVAGQLCHRSVKVHRQHGPVIAEQGGGRALDASKSAALVKILRLDPEELILPIARADAGRAGTSLAHPKSLRGAAPCQETAPPFVSTMKPVRWALHGLVPSFQASVR